MVRCHQGRIVNMSSGVAWLDVRGLSAYCASKSGVGRFSGCVVAETREYGVAVFAIQPGLVRTPLTEAVAASNASIAGRIISEGMRADFDKGQHVPPEHCARLVVQLASGKADMLSGRFVDVYDDIDELIRRTAEIARDDLYSLKRPTFKRASTPL